MPWRAGAAHLSGDIACELEHLPVEEEKAREAELGDQGELLAQALVGAVAVGALRGRVALVEGGSSDPGELDVRRVGAVREVRVVVAELLRQVELEALGDLRAPRDGVAVIGPARR